MKRAAIFAMDNSARMRLRSNHTARNFTAEVAENAEKTILPEWRRRLPLAVLECFHVVTSASSAISAVKR
jgi:hypothetical protein